MLTFPKMIILMTRKSVKSIQNILNEAEIYLSDLLNKDLKSVSNSAYTQARSKLKYEAFIELSGDIRDQFYKDDEYIKYKGFRLLGVDGSIITLPNNKEIQKEFGTTKVVTQYKDKNKEIVQARVSLLYDLLNNIILDAVITSKKRHEIKIVKDEHLKYFKEGDLIIFDRGYPSYEMFATIPTKCKADYLIRTRKDIYKKQLAPLLDESSPINDMIITLKPQTKAIKSLCLNNELPLEIKVRFVKVVLDNGEIEILATSVLDNKLLKTSDFEELYFQRWKIETCYEIIKNRLSLENFTGTTTLSIKQDFYATIFVSNIEAIVTYDLNEELKDKKNKTEQKYQQKVNKSISFNTIKNYSFKLFYLKDDSDIDKVLNEIYKLLRMNKVLIRPNRHYPRDINKNQTKNAIKSSNFQKRKKKIVF